ncbi:MAG: reverse transcriptase-like protein [Anaerolineaceae bacterium]|nr:reverse transcriptase-like protein [Anaerolineaceae bacterium]
MYSLQFDGLFRRFPTQSGTSTNAGFMCYGWLISKDNLVIARGYGGYAWQNGAGSVVAEYLAMIEGMEALLDLGIKDQPVNICGDAKTIIEQMQEKAAVVSPVIKAVNKRARELAVQFDDLSWTWKPRRYNHVADWLTRHALRQIRSDQKNYQATLQEMGTGKNSYRSQNSQPIIDLRIYQNSGMII